MRKHGKRNPKHYQLYKAEKRREKSKLRNIIQSNGIHAAELYAKKHELIGYLNGIK